jgi:predicted glycogen debranching enzyme
MAPTVLASPPAVEPPEYTRDGGDSAALRQTEWLLTSGQGGYAMGTALGTPTRRYHGLFVPSLAPPVQREVMLHSFAETVIIAPGTDREQIVHLTPFVFAGGDLSATCPQLVRFSKTPISCSWLFRIGEVEIEKSLHLCRAGAGGDGRAAWITYSVRPGMDMVRVQLRPLVRMQDAHTLLHAGWPDADFRADASQRHVKIQRGWRTLDMACDSGWFEEGAQWWHNFAYEHERDRGYDWTEDLWSPGSFQLQLRGATPGNITVSAWTGTPPTSRTECENASQSRITALVQDTLETLPSAVGLEDRERLARLIAAADDFVVRRTGNSPAGTSIIAGYPWFSDWGRDSMISICGLLLATRRFEEARSVLATFASHRRSGLIPNLFNDQTGEAEYNTADASLWFLHAACEYLRASEDQEGFETLLKPACLDIVDAYREGTEFGIRMDPVDGLIAAGNANTQLTWMDAKRDGITFTPRHGKPVELSALWYSGLLGVAAAVKRFQSGRAVQLEQVARKTAEHFRVLFWNEARSCLHDCLEPAANGAWKPISNVRPNQIFAVSLPRSALSADQQQTLVRTVKRTLLTPRGLRTLDSADPGYKGRYRGPMRERDAAYHNGTTWPWLLGPLAEAAMRVGGFSPKSRAEAREVLLPLVSQMDTWCPGQLPEVYDGDDSSEDPARPGGCPAQAWSVAETLRALLMTYAPVEKTDR